MPNDQEMRLKSQRHYNESIDKSLRKEVIVWSNVEKTVRQQDRTHLAGSFPLCHCWQHFVPNP